MNTATLSSTESRALALLGSGLGGTTVAHATGVSESRISQLLSDPEFASQVAELRFNNLQKHNARDDKYDEMEDQLLDRLKDLLPMMFEPMKVLKAISVLNSAKRRGASAPQESHNHSTIVNVILPAAIIQKFTTNVNNQVISTGTQDLITVQSSSMDKMLAARTPQLENS